jgi:hypothetical protein
MIQSIRGWRRRPLNRVIQAFLTPQCAPDGCLSNLVVDSKLAHGFASRVAFGNFPALTSIEHGLAAKHGTPGSGSLDALIAALANQLALELVKSAHHREDQLAMGCRGVEPWVI